EGQPGHATHQLPGHGEFGGAVGRRLAAEDLAAGVALELVAAAELQLAREGEEPAGDALSGGDGVPHVGEGGGVGLFEGLGVHGGAIALRGAVGAGGGLPLGGDDAHVVCPAGSGPGRRAGGRAREWATLRRPGRSRAGQAAAEGERTGSGSTEQGDQRGEGAGLDAGAGQVRGRGPRGGAVGALVAPVGRRGGAVTVVPVDRGRGGHVVVLIARGGRAVVTVPVVTVPVVTVPVVIIPVVARGRGGVVAGVAAVGGAAGGPGEGADLVDDGGAGVRDRAERQRHHGPLGHAQPVGEGDVGGVAVRVLDAAVGSFEGAVLAGVHDDRLDLGGAEALGLDVADAQHRVAVHPGRGVVLAAVEDLHVELALGVVGGEIRVRLEVGDEGVAVQHAGVPHV